MSGDVHEQPDDIKRGLILFNYSLSRAVASQGSRGALASALFHGRTESRITGDTERSH